MTYTIKQGDALELMIAEKRIKSEALQTKLPTMAQFMEVSQ